MPSTVASRTDIHEDFALEKLRRSLRFDPYLIKRLRTSFLRSFQGAEKSVAHFPVALRDAFRSSVRFHRLELIQRRDSRVDGATKVLFRTENGQTIETVILRTRTGRTTLCLSSQVGCAAACKFCATGYMGMAQNLSASEILDQVVQAGQLVAGEGRSIRNLVLMGMGEPLHNEQNVYQAIEQLLSVDHFNWPANRILVSTVGVTDAMLRCVERFPRVNLAVSLHSSDQRRRESIIPLSRRYRLDELRKALVRINDLQNKPVMIEYLMLAGINDSAADAAHLVNFLNGLAVHVNLIPFNEIDDAPQLTSSSRDVRDRFAKVLRNAGYVATIRYSLGADIDAACGQLVRKENLANLKSTSGGQASGS